MKKIIAAFVIAFSIFGPMQFVAPVAAQFAESLTPCHGCTPEEKSRLEQIRAQQPQAVGGALGSQTFVINPPKSNSGGFIQIGAAFGDFLQPYIDAAVQALIAALVGWLCLVLKQRTGIEIDEKHRTALTQALSNQAGSLIADGMVKIEGEKISVPSEALAAAAKEAMAKIPQAAKHFGITPDFVAARIIDTIPQIAAGAQLIAKKAESKLP